MNDTNGQFFHQKHTSCFCNLCYLTCFNSPQNQHQALFHESGISTFWEQIHISLLIPRIDLPSNAKYCQTRYSTNNIEHSTNPVLQKSSLYFQDRLQNTIKLDIEVIIHNKKLILSLSMATVVTALCHTKPAICWELTAVQFTLFHSSVLTC